MWCPPYDHLHDDDAFRDAVAETVLQVKLGSTQCAPSQALRMLVEQLLDLDPMRRATIDRLCETTYFVLMLKEGGSSKLLRLTYDSARQSFSDRPSRVRKASRRARTTLSRIDSEGVLDSVPGSPAPTRALMIKTGADLSRPREPDSPTSPRPLHAPVGIGLVPTLPEMPADAPTRPPSFDAAAAPA